MNTPNADNREASRASIQSPKDEVVLHVQNFSLAGRLLAIEIIEVQNAAPGKPLGASTSPLRASSFPADGSSSSSRASRTAGFRVLAVDEVENEYSLFVTRQRAEYLYQAEYPAEATDCEFISLEAMANGILAHLTIIGNRQRGIGKLSCREPEPRVEKKARVVPTKLSPKKHKNPHLPCKRPDQRAVRVQKSSQRAKEAVAHATHHLDHGLNGEADGEADGEAGAASLTPRTIARKSSEASILHRMASADSKTMWKANLETNFEEPIHPLSLEADTDVLSGTEKTSGSLKLRMETEYPLSVTVVKRAVPERKTKHRELDERRQKGRQQRILAAQAAQEHFSASLPSSIQNEESEMLAFSSVAEESEDEVLPSSRRSSAQLSQLASWENKSSRTRASSAPRSSVVIGNAYALRHIGDDEVDEVEQFLRRRTVESTTRRSVLSDEKWDQSITGMGIEITQERPSSQVTLIENDARRIAIERALGANGRQRPSSGPSTGRSSPSSGPSTGRSSLGLFLPADELVCLGSSRSAPHLTNKPEGEQSHGTGGKRAHMELPASKSTPNLTPSTQVDPHAEDEQVRRSSHPRSNSAGSVVHGDPQVELSADLTSMMPKDVAKEQSSCNFEVAGPDAPAPSEDIPAPSTTATTNAASTIATTVTTIPAATRIAIAFEGGLGEPSKTQLESEPEVKPADAKPEIVSTVLASTAAKSQTQAFLEPLEPSPRLLSKSLPENEPAKEEENKDGEADEAEPVVPDPKIEVYPSDPAMLGSAKSANNDNSKIVTSRTGSAVIATSEDSGREKSAIFGNPSRHDETSANQETGESAALQPRENKARVTIIGTSSLLAAGPSATPQRDDTASGAKSPRHAQPVDAENTRQTCWQEPQLVDNPTTVCGHGKTPRGVDEEDVGAIATAVQSPDSAEQDDSDKQCDAGLIQKPGKPRKSIRDKEAFGQAQESAKEVMGEPNGVQPVAVIKSGCGKIHDTLSARSQPEQCESFGIAELKGTTETTLQQPLHNNGTPRSGPSTGRSEEASMDDPSESFEATLKGGNILPVGTRDEREATPGVISALVVDDVEHGACTASRAASAEGNNKMYEADVEQDGSGDESRCGPSTRSYTAAYESNDRAQSDGCVESSECHLLVGSNGSIEATSSNAESYGVACVNEETDAVALDDHCWTDTSQNDPRALERGECTPDDIKSDARTKNTNHLKVHESDPLVGMEARLKPSVDEPSGDIALGSHIKPSGEMGPLEDDPLSRNDPGEKQLQQRQNSYDDARKGTMDLREGYKNEDIEACLQKGIAMEGHSERDEDMSVSDPTKVDLKGCLDVLETGPEARVQHHEKLHSTKNEPSETTLDQYAASTQQEHPEESMQTIQADSAWPSPRTATPGGDAAAENEKKIVQVAAETLPRLSSSPVNASKSISTTKRLIQSGSTTQKLTSASTESTKFPPQTQVSRQKSARAQGTEPKAAARPKPALTRGQTTRGIKEGALSRSTNRRSTAKRGSLPELSQTTAAKLSAHVTKERKSSEAAPLSISKPDKEPPRKRASQPPAALQTLSNYHKKWGKWLVGRNIIEKIGCLQLEELVLADPRNEANLVKLGLRYARWPGTSLSGIVLLEHASMMHKNAPRTHEYWFWMGSAHLDICMRHRKFLPVSRFHLGKSLQSFTRAFAYMESVADPLLLLRYAIGLFWSKGEGNLDKTHDIFHELLSRFVSFCDKDRLNLLFLQFQVLHRLKRFGDAIECMTKILELHQALPQTVASARTAAASVSSTEMPHLAAYDAADYNIMLMQCQQASGDYVPAAATLAAIVKVKGQQQDGSLRDDQYFDLWFTVAEKCFQHEDYTLAMEYYAIALNFAKQSHVLAAIHYNLGLCFQSLGEDSKCVVEYKRARTSNRHVAALLPLTELSASYDERFAMLLRKPIVQVIEEVRVDLYGRAVKRLQRVFRRNRNTSSMEEGDGDTSPGAKQSGALHPSSASSKRQVSNGSNRKLSASAAIMESSEVAGSDDSLVAPQSVGPLDDSPGGPNDPVNVVDSSHYHENFLLRKQVAALQIAELLANPRYRSQDSAPLTPNRKMMPKMQSLTRSGLLVPEKNRVDVRRRQSMEAYRQLGYVPSTMPWVEFWETLLVLALELFESRRALHRCIARIRGLLPLVTHEVAFFSLAESIGNVDEAAERLHDPIYERELTYVCSAIDVSKQMEHKFPLELGQLPQPAESPVRLPTLLSPVVEAHVSSGTQSPIGTVVSPSQRVVLPPYSPIRVASASTRGSNQPSPKRHLRVNQLLDMHFQHHVKQQEAATAIAEATGASVPPQQRAERLEVLQDFRQANSMLLHSQLAFGTEKITT